MLLSLFSAIVLLSSQAAEVKAGANIIRVPDDFPTIQEAINAAPSGATIQVYSGVYYENLVVDKTLVLLGADEQNTVINGSNGAGLPTVNITDTDNVVIDGFTVTAGFIGINLQDANSSLLSGNIIQLDDSNNNTISDNIVSFNQGGWPGWEYGTGIYLGDSSNNTISGNVVNSNSTGIDLRADDNTISGNVVENCTVALISLFGQYNTLFGNVFENNIGYPIAGPGSNNTIFGNNFMDAVSYPSGFSTSNSARANSWSLGGRGNYWDDYTGLDDGSGGRVAGDGVGDTNLPWHGVDYYPLINPTNPFSTLWEDEIFPTSLVSNSTASAFTFDGADREFTFNLNGPANATGYFNLSIPTNLLTGPWTMVLDHFYVTSQAVITENQTYTNICLNYSHDATHSVRVIGTDVLLEYPTAAALLSVALAALPLLVLAMKKGKKKR
jgi:parallel beta-helix repeat protein